MPDDLTDLIEEQASKPASVTTPLGSVTNRSLDELIKANEHLQTQQEANTSRSAWAATRPARIVPPGGV